MLTEKALAFRKHLGVFMPLAEILRNLSLMGGAKCEKGKNSFLIGYLAAITVTLLPGSTGMEQKEGGNHPLDGLFLLSHPRKSPPLKNETIRKKMSAKRMKTKDGTMILV